ncbi:HVA22 homologue A [Prunus dulcis]|uniref:HVA22 homologue A n=1 Tax=Prunus dulcis TaxID=3755 RepID=A0A4Y1RXW6_PRUDU|nr:HVA22 homologue A [Prunus dulcis]
MRTTDFPVVIQIPISKLRTTTTRKPYKEAEVQDGLCGLPLWPYIRLMIVFCMVIPHFDGAFYVYKHLICPCLSMDLQIVINWFNKRKKSSFNRDNFLAEVERYVKENGTEALEKIVASKSERTKSNPDDKELKAVSSLENKESKSRKPNVAQKDIKALQTGAELFIGLRWPGSPHHLLNSLNVSQAVSNLTGTENSRFPSMDIEEKAIGVASERGVLNTPPSKNVEEWTSAFSQVTTQSDTTFNSHPDGKIHKAVYEKLKIENQAEAKLTQTENGTFAVMETKEKSVEVATGREVLESSQNVQKEWTCALCQLTTQSEATLNSHLQGKKHKVACEALKAKSWPFAPKIPPKSKESHQPKEEEPGKRPTSSASKQKVIIDEKVTSQKNSIPASGTKTSYKSKEEPAEVASINGSQEGNPIEVPSMKDLTLSCNVCNVHCPNEIVMASHLNGKKHQKKMQQRQQNSN